MARIAFIVPLSRRDSVLEILAAPFWPRREGDRSECVSYHRTRLHAPGGSPPGGVGRRNCGRIFRKHVPVSPVPVFHPPGRPTRRVNSVKNVPHYSCIVPLYRDVRADSEDLQGGAGTLQTVARCDGPGHLTLRELAEEVPATWQGPCRRSAERRARKSLGLPERWSGRRASPGPCEEAPRRRADLGVR